MFAYSGRKIEKKMMKSEYLGFLGRMPQGRIEACAMTIKYRDDKILGVPRWSLSWKLYRGHSCQLVPISRRLCLLGIVMKYVYYILLAPAL